METVVDQASVYLSPFGFEVHPFKTGWYNDKVREHFQLPYPYDTLAMCILSTPEMFEKGFKPFVKSGQITGSNDPIDEFVSSCLKNLRTVFPDKELEIMFDYEMLPSRRPKILVQTAGHVSGAAFYYRREHVQNDPWDESTKIYGVSLHEKYAGWFGFRGVVIFKDMCVPELQQKPVIDVLGNDAKVIELLEKFNYSWKDWSFRDVAPAVRKYSDDQKLYFQTLPEQRHELLKKMANDI